MEFGEGAVVGSRGVGRRRAASRSMYAACCRAKARRPAVSGGRGDRKQFIFFVNDIVPAALPGLDIALVSQKIVGVLDRDHACAGLRGQKSFGRELAVVGTDSARDVIADLIVELQVGRLSEVGIDFVLGHGKLLCGCAAQLSNLNI